MKTYKAITMKDLPEGIISVRRVQTWFGYTIWRKAVNSASAQVAREMVDFQRVGNTEQAKKVEESFNEFFNLGMFMQDNDLDVIYTDLEDQ